MVVPDASAATHYFSEPPAAEIGTLRVYELPGNRMKPYPGLATLIPSAQKSRSLSRVVMEAAAVLWR